MHAARSNRPAPLPAALLILILGATGPPALGAGITRSHPKSDFWTKAGNDLKTANSKTTHAIDSTWNGLLHDLGIKTAAKHKATAPAPATAASPPLVPWLIGLVNKETSPTTPVLNAPVRWTAYHATPTTSPAATALGAMPAAAPSAPAPTPPTSASHAPLVEAQVLAPLASPAPVPEPSGLLIAAGLVAATAWARRPDRGRPRPDPAP